MTDTLKIADREFNSRLFVGTGKFRSHDAMLEVMSAAKTEIVTVAMRRVDLSAVGDGEENIIDALLKLDVQLLPNTSGAVDAAEAVRMAKLATAMGLPKWVKIEVTPDPRHLLPDGVETLKAAEILVKDGYTVLPYISADPVLARQLEEVGCATVMPLAAPIGTNMGLKTLDFIRIIVQNAKVPVVVDAGIGVPSHAAQAMELGADAVLVNTAIATAGNPVEMANAFRLGVKAGRQAWLAGAATEQAQASASSPMTGLLDALS